MRDTYLWLDLDDSGTKPAHTGLASASSLFQTWRRSERSTRARKQARTSSTSRILCVREPFATIAKRYQTNPTASVL